MNFLILDIVDEEKEMWNKYGIKFSDEHIKLRLPDNISEESFNDIQKLITNKKYIAVKLIKENASVVQLAE
jgi:hypothetical protein